MRFLLYFCLEYLLKKIYIFTFFYCIWIIEVSQQYRENVRKIEQAKLD